MRSHSSVVSSAFENALGSHVWAAFRALLTEDAEWTLPGRSLVAGRATGADALVERAQTLVRYGVQFDVRQVLLGQHGFALYSHNTAVRGTQSLDEWVAIVCLLEAGKVCSIGTFLSDVRQIEEFFV